VETIQPDFKFHKFERVTNWLVSIEPTNLAIPATNNDAPKIVRFLGYGTPLLFGAVWDFQFVISWLSDSFESLKK